MSDGPFNGNTQALFDALRRLESGQEAQGRSIGGLRDDVRQVRDDVHQVRDNVGRLDSRLHELERRPMIPPPAGGLDVTGAERAAARQETDAREAKDRVWLAAITVVGVIATSVATVLTKGAPT